ncbi:MAG: ferrous iron transport protein A [Kiritimatiellae bacterium]|nr:ferrous iron transport protein A [Kiritimatiellia bacterium]
MPITLMTIGSRHRVKAVKGNDAVKKHLASMGFVEGAEVTVISETAGSYILGICDSRVAVDSGLAMRILV